MMYVDKEIRKHSEHQQDATSTSALTMSDQYVKEAEQFASFSEGGKGVSSLVLAKEHKKKYEGFK